MAIDTGGLVDDAAAARVLREIAPRSARASAGEAASAAESGDELMSLDDAERKHIVSVLRATGGNQTQAAFILGIERKTLARKIKRFEIAIEET
jgi:DNA-binding NtrC family response regulator